MDLLSFIINNNLFSIDQMNWIHNHSIYVKTIAIIEDKCILKSTSLREIHIF